MRGNISIILRPEHGRRPVASVRAREDIPETECAAIGAAIGAAKVAAGVAAEKAIGDTMSTGNLLTNNTNNGSP